MEKHAGPLLFRNILNWKCEPGKVKCKKNVWILFTDVYCSFSATCALLTLQVKMSTGTVLHGDFCITSSVSMCITKANKKEFRVDPWSSPTSSLNTYRTPHCCLTALYAATLIYLSDTLDLLIQYHVFRLSFTCVLRLYLNKSIYKDEFSRSKIEKSLKFQTLSEVCLELENNALKF